MTLPLWLDRDGIRIVHACWHPEIIARAQVIVGGIRLAGPRWWRLAGAVNVRIALQLMADRLV